MPPLLSFSVSLTSPDFTEVGLFRTVFCPPGLLVGVVPLMLLPVVLPPILCLGLFFALLYLAEPIYPPLLLPPLEFPPLEKPLFP